MKTLLLVDIQNDFCSNGNLAVKQGEMVVPVANLVIEQTCCCKSRLASDQSQHTSKTVGDY